MYGILNIEENFLETTDGRIDRDKVATALRWLRQNNPHFQQLLPRIETMYGYINGASVGGPLPVMDQSITTFSNSQIPPETISQSTGLVIPATSPVAGVNEVLDNQVAAIQNPVDSNVDAHITYSDRNLEAKIFPWLFPTGRGSWYYTKGGMPMGMYSTSYSN
jgi:hypothetical protein